ncbi:divalent-cation tolerance protein CutA [Sphingomonadaceae bacterium]|nr:divalent-cation tolerance protein CutA [Sphingomonadaceae bacterium]
MSGDSSASGAAMIWCPFPDETIAEAVAGTLVEEKLVACANILGAMKSVFAWEGKLQTSSECGVLFKSSSAGLARAVQRIEELHPYDTPAIMGWNCGGAPARTKDWIADCVR